MRYISRYPCVTLYIEQAFAAEAKTIEILLRKKFEMSMLKKFLHVLLNAPYTNFLRV